jgi:hypothetical protein
MANQKTNKMEAPRKIELVAGTTPKSMLDTVISQAPSGVKIKKLNLPPLVKLGSINVGTTVSGELVGLVDNFTGQESMRNSKTLHLKHESGVEFLLPFSGVIKNSMKSHLDSEGELFPESVGKTFYFTRQPDGASKKYGGKAMFLFDVYETV